MIFGGGSGSFFSGGTGGVILLLGLNKSVFGIVVSPASSESLSSKRPFDFDLVDGAGRVGGLDVATVFGANKSFLSSLSSSPSSNKFVAFLSGFLGVSAFGWATTVSVTVSCCFGTFDLAFNF